MKKTTLESIAAKKGAYQEEKRNYLRQRGWQYTDSIVGGLWTWSKELPDGKTLVATKDSAITIQEIFDSRNGV